MTTSNPLQAATAKGVLVIACIALGMTVASRADESQDFAHEQCANVCQIQLDDDLFQCMPYREDKQQKVNQHCGVKANKKYDKCLSKCPAKTQANLVIFNKEQ